MRIATLNMQHGLAAPGSPNFGKVPDAPSLMELADVIRAHDVDVLCLQEVEQGQRRSSGLNQTEILARELGMEHHRFAAFFQGWVGGLRMRPRRSDADGRMAFGIATLSRFPVTSWHVKPMQAPLPAVRFQRGTLRRPGTFVRFVDTTRAVLGAVVDGPDGHLSVVNTHLSLESAFAKSQLREVMRSVEDLPEPRVLMGDLSLPPEDVAILTGMNALASELTYPSHKPRKQPDHIVASADITVKDSGAVQLPSSDHLMLWADM